jgi:NAD(P)-dependent dehydrogenase (short-subunit alcohol dehydrogenase family)
MSGGSGTRALAGKVAVVAGATRGAGRGIARKLAEAGAFVYCTGRSTKAQPATAGRPETIEETAEMIVAAGGEGLAVRVDHRDEQQVARLFERVRSEQARLDILVNDIWGGDDLTEWQPFWTLDLEKGFRMLDTAVRTHIITSRFGIPLMLERQSGLVVEITDGDTWGYRGTLFYDLAKTAAIRLAHDMAIDLRGKGVTALAVTPGFLRSETMLERHGVTEANWREARDQPKGWEHTETPAYVGRAIAALAADPAVRKKSGKVFATWTLAKEYGFCDADGTQPDWGGYVERSVTEILDRGPPFSNEDRFWLEAWYGTYRDEPAWQERIARIREALKR